MSDPKITINRTLVGILALGCLGSALTIWLLTPNEQLWRGAFMRVGMLLSAFWLALPSGQREAAWANTSPRVFVGILLAVIVIVTPRFRPLVPILIVAAVVGFVLRPRGKQRPKSRP